MIPFGVYFLGKNGGLISGDSMIQMRWLERGIDFRIPFSPITYTDKEVVLQYRQQIDSTVYAGFPPISNASGLTWSNWIDVPTVNK